MIDTNTALHLLLEGRTLRTSDDTLYRMHNEKLTISYNDGLDWHTDSDLNEIEEVLEEFPLTFEQALRAMLDGKVVEVELPKVNLKLSYRFNRELSCFEYHSTCDGKWGETQISESEQKSKWRVVE